jgi:tRNA threonylcarbamoyladenosine modification (KEOPS) complex  Pcc1 subunit
MYTAEILVKGGSVIAGLFEAENKELNQRAVYDIEKKGKDLIFRVRANDSVALRSTLNSITKILTVFEKTKELEQ